MQVNGEGIYATRPWITFGEGPTKVSTGHHTEHENVQATAADIRFTTKDGALFAISLGWPDDGVFKIESLANGNPHESRAVASVEFVSGPAQVDWAQTDEALVIETGGDPPCEAAYVFRIRFAE